MYVVAAALAGRGQESAAEPLPLASSPSSPKHVSSKRIMFVANAIDALATQGDARMRAELRQAGIVPLVPALMNSRDKQACVLGCRLAHALAADIGGRLALRCQSCVHDLMEVRARRARNSQFSRQPRVSHPRIGISKTTYFKPYPKRAFLRYLSQCRIQSCRSDCACSTLP